MTPSAQFSDLIRDNFCVSPIPDRFFWDENPNLARGDIPTELCNRLRGRPWTEINIFDWAMVGTPPYISRRYLCPKAFKYYLPSLFLGVFDNPEYIEFPADAILPSSEARVPHGQWWNEFVSLFTKSDRSCVLQFFSEVRKQFPIIIGNGLAPIVEEAEEFWRELDRR